MGLRKKILLPTVLFVSGILPVSCSSDGPIGPHSTPPPIRQNQAPDTELTHLFGNEGRVTYTFSGQDTDGSIDYIAVQFNNGPLQNFNLSTFSRTIGIVEGTNRVKATAYDNEGKADPTPEEYSFISPTESQATSAIAGVLNTRSSFFERLEREVLLSLGASESFLVDFLVTKTDGTNAVVNYVGHEGNLSEELDNQRVLNTFGIPNLYLVMIPDDEIRSRLNAFIDNGFN